KASRPPAEAPIPRTQKSASVPAPGVLTSCSNAPCSATDATNECHDDSVDLILGSPIGPYAHGQTFAAAQRDLTLYRGQVVQNLGGVPFQVLVVHIVRQIPYRPTVVVGFHTEYLPQRSGETLDTKVTVEEQHRYVSRRHKVLQVVVGARDFLELHLELVIDRLQLLIDALQLLFARFQLLGG